LTNENDCIGRFAALNFPRPCYGTIAAPFIQHGLSVMKLTSVLIASMSIVVLAACGDEPAPTAAAPTPAVSAPAAPVSEPAPAPTMEPVAAPSMEPVAAEPSKIAADLTGVESCDNYLNEYQTCMVNAKVMNAEGIAAMKQGMEATRATWKTMAADAANKAALEMSCKAAMDTLPQTKAAMGC
jgi:hypothetical protein